MNKSLWQDSGSLPRFPALTGKISTDVLIVGGGLCGILTAYMLKSRGISCVLIEAERLFCGVSGHTTAKITSQHGAIYSQITSAYGSGAAALYYRANEAAIQKYRGLCRRIDCGFEETFSEVYSKNSRDVLTAELEACKSAGIPARLTSGEEIPLPNLGAVRFDSQAQFDPARFAAGIVTELDRVYEQTRAAKFSSGKAIVCGGEINAESIIICTHFPILNKHGAYFMKMYQERSYVLALEGAKIAAEAENGMFADAESGGISIRKSGKYLLLGGGGHRTGKCGGGFDMLRDFAAVRFPDSREAYHWATQDCITLDGMPYIGRYSKRTPGLYVATGFNKWGMTSSMVAATVLSEQISGKESRFAKLFSPSRSIFHPRLASNIIESCAGLLTPGRRRCPHLGCKLKWNSQERTWDCSCHGSRFTAGGALLDGPANGNLKK